MTLDTTTLAVIAVLAIVVLALIGWWLYRRTKSRGLRKHFGPEYDHEVAVAGRSKAEDELANRRLRVKEYELRELSDADREDLSRRWHEIQTEFVDHPSAAVEDAALLIDEAMERRGYPVGEIRRKEADLSVHYPQEVQDYRTAYDIAESNRRGQATTEDLRQATVCYRNLFEHLVGLDETPQRRAETA